MDWFIATNASIWAFPPGMNRSGNAGPNSLNWTSKYGSVGAWLQYFLDNYATVDEAANDLFTPEGVEKFQIVTTELIPGTPSVGHVSLADASGDNLILEYLDGVLTIHHGKQYTVLTNQPSYDQQLSINAYWLPIGNDSLPGTRRPPDRFARLSYYNNVTASANDQEQSIAVTASMTRAISVPFSPSVPGEPNVASTLWRTYIDTQALRYYWESSLAPMFLWINLGSMNLTSNAPVRMLELQNVNPETRIGNMDNNFVNSEPFEFLTSAGGSD
ncbi:hypothetical protein RBB50_011890 [Rhinocladiella similis]